MRLAVRYFDGRRSRPHAAWLTRQGDRVQVAPADAQEGSFDAFALPLSEVHWPERTRHGARLARLPGGGAVQAEDVAAWDAWTAGQLAQPEGWVVRAQQNWRATLVALAVLLGALAALYQWGLPVLARGVTALVPPRVDALIGQHALASLDARWLAPSRLPPARQDALREAFARMVRQAHPEGAPAWRLEFRRGRGSAFGPNALALPGGTMVLTDALVELTPGDDDAVLGVLGHEFGHVRQRHAMRQLVQAGAVGVAVSVAFGDFGTLIGSAPVLLATLGYARDAEREADAESLRMMRAAGIGPAAMARFFEAVQRWHAGRAPDAEGGPGAWGIALSTHPPTAERIAFFRDAGP